MADHRENDKNKVPTWDGDGARFQEYKERVKWYVAGLSQKDKGVAGARLAAALTGEAWKALEEVSDEGQELLEQHGGHKTLLKFLDETLMDEPIPEAAKYLKEYLFVMRRRHNEGMKAYAQRSRIVAEKLDQGFRRIEEKDVSYSIKLEKKARPAEKQESAREEASVVDADDDEETKSWDNVGDSRWKNYWWYDSSWWSSSTGSHGKSHWEWPQQTASLKAHKKITLKERATEALCSLMARFDLDEDDVDIKALKEVAMELRETLIPPVMAGWLLLQRAGLNAQERAGVLSSAKNSLNLKNIEAALRDQWADVDLKEHGAQNKKRDTFPHKPGKGRALGIFDDVEDEEQPHENEPEEDWDNEAYLGEDVDGAEDELELEGLEDEERLEAEEALAVIAGVKKDFRTQKRTLAQARAVVKDIKQSRGFYQKGKSRGKGRGGRGPGPCFTCGGAHKQAVCPKGREKTGQAAKDKVQNIGAMAFSFAGWDARTDVAEVEPDTQSLDEGQPALSGAMLLKCPEAAPIETTTCDTTEVAYHAQDVQLHHALAGLEEETEGCMVLDCGATKTFGSIKALEKIVEKQRDAGLDMSCVTVDTTDRPNFGFANGSAEKCSSRATLPLQADGRVGTVASYALNTKNNRYVPLLGSVDFMKRAGAIIDFETGIGCFKKISFGKLIKLKRISTGHLCIDMTRDLYGNKLTKAEKLDFRQKLEKMLQQCGDPEAAQAGLATTPE